MTAPMHIISEPGNATAAMHPLRLRILSELGEPESATGLSRRLGMPRQLVNYHVRQLERAGLVEPVLERKRRNCTERLVRAVARSYLIDPAALGTLAADPDRIADRTSSAYQVAAAARLIRELAGLREAAQAAGKQLATLTAESEVAFATPEAQAEFARDLAQAIAQVIAKHHAGDVPGARRFRLLAAAWPRPAGAPTPQREESPS